MSHREPLSSVSHTDPRATWVCAFNSAPRRSDTRAPSWSPSATEAKVIAPSRGDVCRASFDEDRKARQDGRVLAQSGGRHREAEAPSANLSVRRDALVWGVPETRTIRAWARIGEARIQRPFPDVAREIELAPETGSERGGPDGRHVRHADAMARAARVVTRINRVLAGCPRRRNSPSVFPLLAPPRRGVFPFGFAREKPAVPYAEGVRLVPIDAVDRQVLMAAERCRPSAVGRALPQI